MNEEKVRSQSINAVADDAPVAPKAKTFTEFMEDSTTFTQVAVSFAFLIPVMLGIGSGLWLLAVIATKALARELGVIK